MFILLLIVSNSQKLFTCNETSCKLSMIGNRECDIDCMNPACNYDSDFQSYDKLTIFSESDCFESCSCDKTLLADDKCDFECDNYECGWDLGDCGYCSSGCFEADLIGLECIGNCDLEICLYGNNNCVQCQNECSNEDLKSNICTIRCMDQSCEIYDSNPCKDCATNCDLYNFINGKCDYYCYNSNCAYDNGDCDCSPGCSDINGDCATFNFDFDPCDVKECNFKNGKCGYCASGCFKSNLGDGICQWKCNNPDCNYDNGDCGCSPGCGFVFDETIKDYINIGYAFGCDYKCLVPECHFGIDFCTYKDIVKKGVLSYLVFQNSSKFFDADICNCSRDLISGFLNETENCESNSECYSQECLYCMGQANISFSGCLKQNFDKCLLCDSTMVVGTCQKDLNACPTGYENKKALADEFNNKLWCLKEAVHYSTSNYKIIYVDSTFSNNGIENSENIYSSLYHALLEVYATFSKIFLLNKEIEFSINDKTSIFVPDKYDPLNSNSIYSIYELWIIGNYSETVKTKVYWKDNLKITPLARNFFIKNIEFIGTYVLKSDCASEFCSYCPFVEYKLGNYYNDKGDVITESEFYANYSTNCNFYSEIIVFNFRNEVYIENTDFYNFRYQYSSFIKSSRILNLKNVNFLKMQSKSSGSIILLECISKCNETVFNYYTGTVSDLGAGYDSTENAATGSFIKSFEFGSVVIKNVSFSFNFLFSSQLSSSNSYLFYSRNHIGTINILDSLFESNYVNYLLYIDVSSLIYDDYKIKKALSMAYSQEHILLDRIKITKNYCSQGIIYYLMNKIVQNINFSNILISDSVTGNEGALVFINQGIILNSDIYGDIEAVPDGFLTSFFFIPPRYLQLENITFENSFTGQSFIYVTNYPNVRLKNIKIHNITDGKIDDVMKIINTFKTNDSSRYLENLSIFSNIPDINCNEMIFVSNSEFLSITSIFISDIYCKSETVTSGIFLQNINGFANLDNLKLTNMEASISTGIALTVLDSNSIFINHLEVFNIVNLQDSIVKFDNCNLIFLELVDIKHISSYYSGAIIVSRSTLFILHNFTITNSSSEYSDGGCFYFLTGILGSKYLVRSGILNGCTAKISKGGAMYLDSLNRNPITTLYVNNVFIKNCYSEEGSALYISGSVSFKDEKDSILMNLNIHDNHCSDGGTVQDYHYFGKITLDKLILKGNIEIYCIYGFYANDFPSLVISNTNINESNSKDSLIFLLGIKPGSTAHLQNLVIYNTLKTVLKITNLKVFVEKMIIFKAYNAINLNTDAEFEAYELQIINVKNKAVVLANNSTFNCSECIYKENYDTILLIGSSSVFNLINTSIFSNFPVSEHLISITSAESISSNLIDCEIYLNVLISGALIFASSSELILQNVSMVENKGLTSLIHGITINKSQLKILNSNFQFNTLVDTGAFIYATTGSLIDVKSSIFKNSISTYGNIYGSDTIVNIISCSFFGNTGGDIFTDASNLYITDSSFESSKLSKNRSGVVEMSRNIKTVILNSTFENIIVSKSFDETAYIYDNLGSELEIINSEIAGGSYFCIGIYVKNCKILDIQNTNLHELNTSKYSAVTAISDTNGKKLTIKNSKIRKNLSENNGGGFYLENYNVTFFDTDISYNKALISGGGIYFRSPLCDECGIYFTGITQISNNLCERDGGAIKWEDFKPYFENDSLVFNNSAKYGADFATVPARFGLYKNRELSDSVLLTFFNVPPRKKYMEENLLFIYDSYGQVITTENSLTATLYFNKTIDSINTVSGVTTFKAQNGVLTISNLTFAGVPGSIAYLVLQSENMRNGKVRNDYTEYFDSAFIKVEFRECEKGEQIQATGCVDCIPGKYTLKASLNCLDCPTGATCTGGGALIVKNGYWRSSLESDIIYACDTFDACLEGNQDNELGFCSEGYSGVLCKSCDKGYSMTSNEICTKCSDGSADIPILIILCIAIITISVIMVKTTLTSAFSPKSLHSIYIKIFTNYLQLVFIVSQFKLEWPSYVSKFFFVQKSGATITDQIFSIDCFIGSNNLDEVIKIYFLKLCLVTATPLAIIVISYIYWFFYSNFKETFKYLKREVYTTIIVLLFLVYPNVVRFMFSNFSCVKIDKMSSYLNYNTAIKCWDMNHRKFSLIFALPGIILWGVGFPTILLILMTKNRKRLHLDYYRVVFGFLYNGYKQRKFYWELAIIYRKILLITLSVFMISQARIVQALNVILILIVCISIHYSNQPYNSEELNKMEMQALNIASITIYFGLYYLSKSINEGIEIILFILIVLGNSYFIIYWLYYISKALIDIFIKKFPRFRLKFKRGDVFEEEFYQEEVVQEGVYFNRLEGEKACTFFKHQDKLFEDEFMYKSIEDAFVDVLKRDVRRILDEHDLV